jgi:virginiamycin B lyase
VTGWPRDELVEARADAILAGVPTAEAYAEHFEAQMRAGRLAREGYRGQVRRLRSALRVLRRPGVTLLAMALVPCGLFGYAAATAGITPVMVSGANELAAVNTASGQLVAVAPLPGPPGAVSAADGSVWVTDPGAGQVLRIDPGTGAQPARVPVGGEPGAIASGGGAIWVADTTAAAVDRIDPATDRVIQTITLPWAQPGAIAFAAGRVWVADPAARLLAEIDPATGSLERTLSVDLQPSAIATVGQAIWVAGYGAATVEELAAASGRVLARVRVGGSLTALAAGAGSLWAVGSGTITRIDPLTAQVTATLSVTGTPDSLTIAGGRVWAGMRQATETGVLSATGWHLYRPEYWRGPDLGPGYGPVAATGAMPAAAPRC